MDANNRGPRIYVLLISKELSEENIFGYRPQTPPALLPPLFGNRTQDNQTSFVRL